MMRVTHDETVQQLHIEKIHSNSLQAELADQ